MPNTKNQDIRFQILDRCFSDYKHKYTFNHLLELVNDRLYELSGSQAIIKTRQLRNDISHIRKILPDGIYLDSYPYEGKERYYRYTEPNFSIYKNELSVTEVQNLRSTIEMLGKYRGLPSNSWLEEVISNLEIRFGIKANSENLVSFGQNEQLKGLEHLSYIIDATTNHQPLEIEYVPTNEKYHKHIIHPYFVKQYNGRWFLFGLDNKEERIKNLALDRIQSIKESTCIFRKNETIDFNSYFNNVVGVTVPSNPNEELLDVQLKFTPNRFKYVTSKPIHKSQTIVNQQECIISLKLYFTVELEQQIFSFGPDVEILSPIWLREEFAKKIADCMKKYFSMHNNCTEANELCSR